MPRAGKLWSSCGIRGLRAQLAGCPQRFQHAAHLVDTRPKTGLACHVFGDAIQRVDDRGVVAPAERVADLHELQRQQLAAQVHRHLARAR